MIDYYKAFPIFINIIVCTLAELSEFLEFSGFVGSSFTNIQLYEKQNLSTEKTFKVKVRDSCCSESSL